MPSFSFRDIVLATAKTVNVSPRPDSRQSSYGSSSNVGAGSSKEPDCLETNGSELLDLIKYQAREIINVGGKDETVGLGAKTGLLYLVPFTSVFVLSSSCYFPVREVKSTRGPTIPKTKFRMDQTILLPTTKTCHLHSILNVRRSIISKSTSRFFLLIPKSGSSKMRRERMDFRSVSLSLPLSSRTISRFSNH